MTISTCTTGYYNHWHTPQAEQVVIVEGQADAITFAEWGIPAVAIAGMNLSDALVMALRNHTRVFVALDNTDEAREKSREIARRLGGETYLPEGGASNQSKSRMGLTSPNGR
jgi:hypothetical protein